MNRNADETRSNNRETDPRRKSDCIAPLGTVRLISLDRASREKTLAPTNARMREKTGCITPSGNMAALNWHNISTAKKEREKDGQT